MENSTGFIIYAICRSISASSRAHVPVALSVGRELAAMPGAQAASVTEFEDFAHALEERGYTARSD